MGSSSSSRSRATTPRVSSDSAGEPGLTLDFLRETFARHVPLPATLGRVGWASRFRIHSRVAPRYRVGNVFLAVEQRDHLRALHPLGARGEIAHVREEDRLLAMLAHTLVLFDGRAPTAEGYDNLARISAAASARLGDQIGR